MDVDTRKLLADERRKLADVLADLTPEQWNTQSLSAGWTVRHVVAHLIMPFRYSTRQIVFKFLKARGDFNRLADAVARKDALLPTGELVSGLRDNATHPFTPPGAGYEAPLSDLVVHTLDICRPLAIRGTLPAETKHIVLDNAVSARSLKHFGMTLEGIELRATDVDWRHGSGASAVGLAEDLLLVLCGRPAGAAGVTGKGGQLLLDQLAN